MEDLNDKVTGGTLTASEWNQVPSELQNIIEQTGQTLSGLDLNQLGKGVANYVGTANFYNDSGIANGYVLTVIGSIQGPTQYFDGLSVRFIAANSNTGASTINVNALGNKNLRDRAGIILGGGVILAGQVVLAFYDLANDEFRLSTLQTTGTVTSVTGGLGLVQSGSPTDPVIDVFAGEGITVLANETRLDLTSDRNIDHTTISILAGDGLTGGGNIASTKTLNVGAGNGLTVAADTVDVGAGNGISVAANSVAMSGSFTGTFSATGDVIAFASDIRLKDIIGHIPNALDKVNELSGVIFSWKNEALDNGAEDIEQVGLIAQDVECVLPQAVRESTFMEGCLTVSYMKIIPLLVESIKELTQRVEELEERLEC